MPFTYRTYIHERSLIDGSVLLAGDDEGFVWAYDLSKVHGQLPNPDERDRKGPLELRHTWVIYSKGLLSPYII